MTQDEIIEMARQAGFTQPEGETWYEAFPQCIEAFAKLVEDKAFQDGYEKGVAAFNEAVELEREACAKLCMETEQKFAELSDKFSFAFDAGGVFGASQCLNAIRARGEA